MKGLKKQNGLAAVEFVLITPLIIVFMALYIEIGSMFVDYQTLNKAVRNGARFAVTSIYGTATTQQIAPVDEIKNMVVYGRNPAVGDALLPGLVVDGVSVSHVSDVVTVTADYSYVPYFATIPFLGVDMSVNFSASAVMETGL
ncbi:TadE/TadG family type IV pilus assembly protein [Vibrio mediterranei]|uniref:TadE/TadG family type IV pilus assembly protein n=1 Tax=Vibrio mediterranei TaxID=689 RepID=UPI00148C7371|nr:TadE family protein [Vibrio mediterranei]NOI24330.1 pilus assembly protein [Vibrio mediterranei]